jgi:lysozyme
MNMDKLMKELIMDEGFKYEIYLDHLGYPTMGVGHLITEKDEEHGKPVGTPVSEDRIKECLDNDIKIVCDELDMKEPWWRNLSDNRQRVVANMCFNLGHPRLSKFKNFINAMQISDWERAAEEMMDSKWSGQVGDRAVRLRDRVLKGDD